MKTGNRSAAGFRQKMLCYAQRDKKEALN